MLSAKFFLDFVMNWHFLSFAMVRLDLGGFAAVAMTAVGDGVCVFVVGAGLLLLWLL